MAYNFWTFNYDPHKCPCYECKERSVGCHGKCEKYKKFIDGRIKPQPNTYVERGKIKDPFHKKGRVITKR